MIVLDIVQVIIGLFGLYIGGNWLVGGSSRLARSFGIPVLIIGLTFVAIGTSMPELMVSVLSAIQGSSDIALGNVVGSNIANIGLILGLTGVLAPITVGSGTVRREIPVMIVVSVIAFLMVLDGEVGRLDGLLLLIGFVVFNWNLYRIARREGREAQHEAEIEGLDTLDTVNRQREILFLVIGVIALVVGAQFMVSGATSIARSLGVREIVIGITMVAFGTSLPELAASLIATRRGQNDITVGNVIGSNVANLLLVLGLTAVILPIPVAPGLSQFEFPVMLGFSILLLPFAVGGRLTRRESAIFLGAYAGFILYTFTQSGA